MKRADKFQARVTLLIGGDELARGEVTVRNMATGDQIAVGRSAVVEHVRQQLV
jgi:histidyl-tRNA synthetase